MTSSGRVSVTSFGSGQTSGRALTESGQNPGRVLTESCQNPGRVKNLGRVLTGQDDVSTRLLNRSDRVG